MKVFNDDKFDERQLLERGKAFRNAYFVMVLTVAICHTVNSFAEDLLDIQSLTTISIWASLFAFAATAILHDAYEPLNQKCFAYFLVMGLGGVFMIGVSLWDLFFDYGNAENISDFINSEIRLMFSGVFMMGISVVYTFKHCRDKKPED